MATQVIITEHGGPEVLELVEFELPELKPGEVRIRQTTIGINFIDTYHRTGLYALPSTPHGIGMEAAGVVTGIGEGVTEFVEGDRVAYASGPAGAYATERIMPEQKLVPIPDAVDDATAASVLLKGMTVEYLIRRTYPVQPGMTVLFHAAAGGVGRIACQWLNHIGARVIGTVSSEEKANVAREHGCHIPIIYTKENFAEKVLQITDQFGVPVVYDSIGRTTLDGSLECLSRRGTLVGFGNASGPPEPFDVLRLARMGSLYLTRPTLFDYIATREELLMSAAAVFEVVGAGAVKASPSHTWPLAEAAEAHRALEARETTGSIVLTV